MIFRAIVLAASMTAIGGIAQAAENAIPKVNDDRLSLKLFADAPDIVTPVGIAIDAKGRVLAIESNTHFRPAGYKGAEKDRILRFEDTNGDGKADRIETFFEGTTHTMGMAFHPDGTLYVCTRMEVFTLRDDDNDGKADAPKTIIRHETEGNYPHNGLCGFAFDFRGNVYFGQGENLGAPYTIRGTDGKTHSGHGEGGNMYRCKPDGSGLEHISTGFWNPFAHCFDVYGRLFVVDNDPDSRPPCRLLHVVDGADFGYRFRNGRKGVHPFTAWNGEIPGTLPMVSGTGEAPSGMLAYESDNLPSDYRGSLLVTSWGDHRIEQYKLEPRGASFKSTMKPVVTGDENFRPVGIITAQDGSIYFTDWVDKSYPLHSKGRIWRLSSDTPSHIERSNLKRMTTAYDRNIRETAFRKMENSPNSAQKLEGYARGPGHPLTRLAAMESLIRVGSVSKEGAASILLDPDDNVRAFAVESLPDGTFDPLKVAKEDKSPLVRANALRRVKSPDAIPYLLTVFEDSDPYVLQAARTALQASAKRHHLVQLLSAGDPKQRLQVLLTLRATGDAAGKSVLPKILRDDDPLVRAAAVQWIAEDQLVDLKPQLLETIAKGASSRQLMVAYVTALAKLDSAAKPGGEIAGDDYLAKILVDPNVALPVRKRALRMIKPEHPALTVDFLKKAIESGDPQYQLEAVRALRDIRDPKRFDLLRSLVQGKYPERVRAEAAVGMAAAPDRGSLASAIAEESSKAVRDETLRSLRSTTLDDAQQTALKQAAEKVADAAELVGRALAPGNVPAMPASEDSDRWMKALEGPASAEAGERIFFHPNSAGCYRCHTMDGRGGGVGPDLSNVGKAMSHQKLVESIVNPSKEVSPQFVTWMLALEDGTVVAAVLLGEGEHGAQTYADATGKIFTVKPSDVAERNAVPTSIMPSDLSKALTMQELRDLIAYLRSNREE